MKVEALEMDGVWDMKPMFDGRQVVRLLPGLPRGPAIGHVMDKQIEWQILNPAGNEDACRAWLEREFASYTK